MINNFEVTEGKPMNSSDQISLIVATATLDSKGIINFTGFSLV